jgi:hypothetical protein
LSIRVLLSLSFRHPKATNLASMTFPPEETWPLYFDFTLPGGCPVEIFREG